ncbi:hypothetical protein ACFP1Z_23955 [Streptomyces gamaensis]|uniref:Uncharacterized protein n=1 Tax=Streptomyces gamaensis TaxID=1763542 RepID=A0ABW0Z6X4_9ACTN
MSEPDRHTTSVDHRTAFIVNRDGTAERNAHESDGMPKWAPEPGELVTDTSRDRVGKAIGWDGHEVTIRPLDGGEPWHTSSYRPANAQDRLRARVVVLNRERRSRSW